MIMRTFHHPFSHDQLKNLPSSECRSAKYKLGNTYIRHNSGQSSWHSLFIVGGYVVVQFYPCLIFFPLFLFKVM